MLYMVVTYYFWKHKFRTLCVAALSKVEMQRAYLYGTVAVLKVSRYDTNEDRERKRRNGEK